MVPTGAQMLLSMLGIDAKKIAELFDAINKDDVLGLLDRIKGLVERIEEIDRRTARIEGTIATGSSCACRVGHSDGRPAQDGDGDHAVTTAHGTTAIVDRGSNRLYYASPETPATPTNNEHV